jgi:lipid-A-disaccharide synthase
LIKLKFISLVNIVAGRKIVPEFLQFRAKPDIISQEMVKFLNHPSEIDKMILDLSIVNESLGSSGASANAAQIIDTFLYN